MRKVLAHAVSTVAFLLTAPGCFANHTGFAAAGTGGNANTDVGNTNTSVTPPAYPFEAVSTRAYANKVKTLLTGLPVSDAEAAAAADPAQMAGLIDAWMTGAQFETNIKTFFAIATQQYQVQPFTFGPQMPASHGPSNATLQDLQDIIPQTALYYAKNNIPMNQILNTNTFMMNTRVLSAYAMFDALSMDDNGSIIDYYRIANPNFHYTYTSEGGPIDIARSNNPADPDYMVFYVPSLTTDCNHPVGNTVDQNRNTVLDIISIDLYLLITGVGNIGYVQRDPNAGTAQSCHLIFTGNPNLFVPSDYDWRLVTLRRPTTGEKTLDPWDLPTMRTADTVVLRTPRYGFWSTPVFFAQWQTNINNQARGTVNQTLIAALDSAFDGSDQTMPASLSALAPDHATPGTACYACHLTMDPMRQFFRQAYSVNYGVQRNPNEIALPGVWARDKTTAVGTDISDFANHLAASPEFALAWTQKLCAWVNSAPCSKQDPELQRLAANFAANNYSFYKLLKDVLLSPLTSYASSTATAEERGTVMTVARRDQLCSTLSARLKIPDLCGLRFGTALDTYRTSLKALLTSYPADTYYRGTVNLAQVNQPAVTLRIGLENACGWIAYEVIDNGASPLYRSTDPNGAISSFVNDVMGIPQTQAPAVNALLSKHYQDAMAAGLTGKQALQSTFVVSCMSPSVVSSGL